MDYFSFCNFGQGEENVGFPEGALLSHLHMVIERRDSIRFSRDERLRLLTQTTDGFKIAEKDMELRGPGEMFGERQSGMLSTGLSMLAGDTQLLKLTHDEARALMKRPDDEETKQVVALARRAFRERLDEVALN